MSNTNIINTKIGIVGGGQLGKMMILQAKRLGFYVVVLDPIADCPASSICDELIVAPLDQEAGYLELAGKVDVITYEWENISAEILDKLADDGKVVYPSVKSLKIIQNKFIQNSVLRDNNIAVPRFEKIASVQDIIELGKDFGFPMILKTTMGGYDGKGTALIKTESDTEAAFSQLGGGKVELFVEEFVDFALEVSVIACRAIDGECAIYPVVENIHTNSILDISIVPARIDEATTKKAIDTAFKVMDVFEGVGTFGIELFVYKNGDIGVNEIAPRPHNSGHYTIEGCFTDQFENHIRAITTLPLGKVELIKPTVMVNLLGESDGAAKITGLYDAYRKYPNVKIHFYGKPTSKTGRKMGHYTVVADTLDEAVDTAMKLKEIVKIHG